MSTTYFSSAIAIQIAKPWKARFTLQFRSEYALLSASGAAAVDQVVREVTTAPFYERATGIESIRKPYHWPSLEVVVDDRLRLAYTVVEAAPPVIYRTIYFEWITT